MTNDIVVVIPAYEPSDRFPDLIGDLVAGGLHRIVIVDDGSGPGYRHLFDRALGHGDGTEVLRHAENSGKGTAIRTALEHVLASHPDVIGVVTADADGQHLVSDIQRVARELLQRAAGEPASVCILGERNFNLPAIPTRSRLGNRLTSGIVRLLFGRALPDTQTGLRGVTRDLIPELLKVPGDRFDYEMRALMHLLTHRTPIVGVEITTVYENGENATSHFRPVRDSAIIYGAILRQLGTFVLTSGLGFLVDILVFVLVMDLAFGGDPTIRAVGISTVVARLVSMAVNFGANHFLVFRSGATPQRSAVRYGVLALGILTASWLLTAGLSHVLGDHVVWAKILVDSALFFASYLVQRHWVFRQS